MSSRKYEKLEQDSVASEETEGFLPHNGEQIQTKWMSTRTRFSFNIAAVVLIILSVLCNAFLFGEVRSLRKQHDGRVLHPKTDYRKSAHPECRTLLILSSQWI